MVGQKLSLEFLVGVRSAPLGEMESDVLAVGLDLTVQGAPAATRDWLSRQGGCVSECDFSS